MSEVIICQRSHQLPWAMSPDSSNKSQLTGDFFFSRRSKVNNLFGSTRKTRVISLLFWKSNIFWCQIRSTTLGCHMPITNSSSKRCTEIPLVKIRLTRIVFPFCSNYIIKKSNDTHTGFNVYSIHHFSCDDRHEMVVSERETKIKKSKLAVYEYNQTTHRRTSYLVVTTRPQ